MSFTSDLRWALVGRSVSALGDAATVIALTLALASRGPWAVSALLIAGFAPALLMAPLAGALADRRDSRELLVGAGVLQTALSAVLAFTSSLPSVLVLLFVIGACQAVVGSTWTSLVPELVGRDEMARAVATLQAWGTGAMVLGPALGGVLVGMGGVRTALLMDTGTFALATVAALAVRTRRHVAPSEEPSRFADGVAVLREDPVLRLVLPMLFVFVLLGAATNVADVFLVRVTLHAGATTYGVLSAGFGASMVLGSVLSGRVTALSRGAVAAVVLLAGSMIGSGVAPSVLWLVPFTVLGGMANALLNTCVNTLLALRVPADNRGRVAATVSGAINGGLVVAMLLGGLLVDQVGPRAVFVGCGIVGMIIPTLVGRRLVVVPTVAKPLVVEHAPVG